MNGKIICDRDKCTGCGACSNICPVQCIKMEPDKNGFLIPVVDGKICIECGKCEKSCPVLNPVTKVHPRKVLAACEKEEELRGKSASGGIAGALYRRFLENDGVVYGVAFNEEHFAVYDRKEKGDSIESFRGSKYTGSLMGDVYTKVKNDLKTGRNVLFIGMGCQIAGMLNYLGRKPENLYTVDILCHGMPSHLYLKEYIEELKKKYSSEIRDISFRNNNLFRLKCEFDSGVYECPARYDRYFAGYTSMLFYRTSCYTCPYASDERCADITVGDFWGYGNEKRLSPSSFGVSMLLVNTEAGEALLDMIKADIKVVGSTFERAERVNSQLRFPSPIHPLRQEFLETYAEYGFHAASEKVIGKIIRRNRREEIKKFLKRKLSFPFRAARFTKKKLKKIFGKKNIGKISRMVWRNRLERKRLNHTDFTIISNTCIGGIIYHDMGIKFQSPTVNLYMRPGDFVKFAGDLEYYLSLDLEEVIHPAPYPVGRLGDLTLYLKHYESFDEAKAKWTERKQRINYDKIYLMMTDRDFIPPGTERWACDRETLLNFSKLPYRKVCFTGEEYEDIPCCKTVSKNKEGRCVNIITDIIGYSGRRLYQYAPNFDYIDWLNGEETK